MKFSLLPKIIVPALTDVSVELLKSRNIKLLMLDFDNTIVPYTTSTPTAKMRDWLEEMVKSDIELCVVSNSHKDRVKIFCEKHGIDCITHAKKPFSKGICECLNKYQIAPVNCALVGDQIFTDILGGRRAGITALLVRPIRLAGNPGRYIRYWVETPFRLVAQRRGKL